MRSCSNPRRAAARSSRGGVVALRTSLIQVTLGGIIVAAVGVLVGHA